MLLPRHPIQKETRRYFQRYQWLRSWLVLFSSLKVDVVVEVVHMLRIYWHCSSGSDCLPHSNTDLDLVKVKGNSFFSVDESDNSQVKGNSFLSWWEWYLPHFPFLQMFCLWKILRCQSVLGSEWTSEMLLFCHQVFAPSPWYILLLL